MIEPALSPPPRRSRGRLALAAGVALLAAGLAVAGAVRRAGREVSAEPVRHDFGRARAGSVIRVACVIENRTAVPLGIIDVQTTCGCATIGPRPPRVPARSAVELPVEVELPADRHGPFGTKVAVVFVGPSPPRAFVIEGFVHLPHPPAVNFSTARRDEKVRKTFAVRAAAPGKPVQVLAVRCDENRFVVRHARSTADAEAVDVTVELRGETVEGAFESPLTLETDDRIEPTRDITLKGYVLRPVETDLAAVSFGTVDTAEPRRASFRVYSPYDKPFEIRAIRLEPANLLRAETVKDANGPGVAVHLTLTGPLPDQHLSGRAVVDVECDSGPRTLSVDLYATRDPPPLLPAAPGPAIR